MYPVSDEYKQLINERAVVESISGRIRTKGGESIAITDADIKTGSLQIDRRMAKNGMFALGSVTSDELSMTLINYQGIAQDLNGATIRLTYNLHAQDAEETTYSVPLGIFYVDGSSIKRTNTTISLKAYDDIMRLDIPTPTDYLVTGTLGEIMSKAVISCAVRVRNSAEEFMALPNADLNATVNAARMQTWRDVVQFIATATGCIVRSHREGGIEFVPLTATLNETTGKPVPVRDIKGEIRRATTFSDDRIRPYWLSTRHNGKVLRSTAIVTAQDNQHLTVEIPENPFYAALSDSDTVAALNKTMHLIYLAINQPFSTKFIGDPSLEVGDYVRLVGGAIDTRNGYCYDMITQQTWRYRGPHTLVCRMPESIYSSAEQTDTAEVTALSDEEAEELWRVRPKDQLEKRVDALENSISSGGSGGGSGTLLKEYEVISDDKIKYNGSIYTITTNSDGVITTVEDNNGGKFSPKLLAATNVNLHNAAFLAVTLMSILPQKRIDIPNLVARYNIDKYHEQEASDGVYKAIVFDDQIGHSQGYELRNGVIDDGGVKISPYSSASNIGYCKLDLDVPLTKYSMYFVINEDTLNGDVRTLYVNSEQDGILMNICGYALNYYYDRSWRAGVKDGGDAVVISDNYPGKTVVCIRCDGTKTNFFVNGINSGTVEKAQVIPYDAYFSNGHYAYYYFDTGNIWIYDIAVCDFAHDDAAIKAASLYLMDKYSIKS